MGNDPALTISGIHYMKQILAVDEIDGVSIKCKFLLMPSLSTGFVALQFSGGIHGGHTIVLCEAVSPMAGFTGGGLTPPLESL